MSGANTGGSVLVVEDSAEIRGTLQVILQSEGLDVQVAANGADALALLRRAAKQPAVILLDLMMPVMDGYQFRDEQRRDPELSAIPVVILTADGQAAQKADSLGAAGFLAKPVDLDTLLAGVARFCRPDAG